MNVQLCKEYTSFFFALNELGAEELDTRRENQAHQKAYELAARNVHRLPRYTGMLNDGAPAPRYSLNPDDTFIEERQGVLAWSIQVEANQPLDPATVQELRGFFEDCYLQAAEGSSLDVRYVDGERFKVYSDHQMVTEDFV